MREGWGSGAQFDRLSENLSENLSEFSDMSKLTVSKLKIFLRKISGNSNELHTNDLSKILVLQNLSQNLSENLSQKDFWKAN